MLTWAVKVNRTSGLVDPGSMEYRQGRSRQCKDRTTSATRTIVSPVTPYGSGKPKLKQHTDWNGVLMDLFGIGRLHFVPSFIFSS